MENLSNSDMEVLHYWPAIKQHVESTGTMPPIECSICYRRVCLHNAIALFPASEHDQYVQELKVEKKFEQGFVLECGHVFGLKCIFANIEERAPAPGQPEMHQCPICSAQFSSDMFNRIVDEGRKITYFHELKAETIAPMFLESLPHRPEREALGAALRESLRVLDGSTVCKPLHDYLIEVDSSSYRNAEAHAQMLAKSHLAMSDVSCVWEREPENDGSIRVTYAGTLSVAHDADLYYKVTGFAGGTFGIGYASGCKLKVVMVFGKNHRFVTEYIRVAGTN